MMHVCMCAESLPSCLCNPIGFVKSQKYAFMTDLFNFDIADNPRPLSWGMLASRLSFDLRKMPQTTSARLGNSKDTLLRLLGQA